MLQKANFELIVKLHSEYGIGFLKVSEWVDVFLRG